MPLQQIDPTIAFIAIAITVKARTLGLISVEIDTLSLDTDNFSNILRAICSAGFKMEIPVDQLFEYAPEKILNLLDKLEREIETKPLPELDLKVLLNIFGLVQTSALLGVEELRRYLDEPSELSQASKERAHYLAMIISDLTGSYTQSGIQKWFQRKRTTLNNVAPLDLLKGNWTIADSDSIKVRQLAAALVTLGAT